jgi:putative effector of murein hydrolase
MKEKIKTQKGFIQIPILIAIIVSVVVVSGIGYGTIEYNKTSKIINEA